MKYYNTLRTSNYNSMAEDLGWFKFSPLKWMTGKIRKEKEKVQIAFLGLVCQYWKDGCDMTVDKARDEIGDSIDALIKRKIVKVDGEKIKIDFLDEQMVAIGETSKQRSSAAKSRWTKEHSKTMQVHASAMQVHTGAMQIDADREIDKKERQDEIIAEWISWGKLIIAGQDQHWENLRGQKITQTEMDKFLSVATRKKWDMPTQQAFRVSLKGFFEEGPKMPKKQKYVI